MVDLYTKVVLTVIAAALVMIAGQDLIATKASAVGAECGGSFTRPCFIRSSDLYPIKVVVQDDRIFPR